MRNWTGFWVCVFVCLAGCQPAEQPSAGNSSASSKEEKNKKYTIAVIPKGTLHVFWKSIHAGAIKAERELGNVEVVWKGPVQEDDREQQIQVVEGFINRGVDAIVLAPLDRRALVRPVKAATAKGIPVVIVDSGVDTDEITSYIATDNYNGGVIAARHMIDLLDGKGNVVVLRYQVGSASTEQREKGFLETIAKDAPQIKIISDNQYAGAKREGAIDKAEILISRFGDQIDGWFCPCEPVIFGTIRAMKNRGAVGDFKVVGFDATPEIVEALKNQEIHGLVLQDPINMGYLGVKTAVAALEGKEVADKISTGENLVTFANMNEEKYKQLHSPDLSIYLGE